MGLSEMFLVTLNFCINVKDSITDELIPSIPNINKRISGPPKDPAMCDKSRSAKVGSI